MPNSICLGHWIWLNSSCWPITCLECVIRPDIFSLSLCYVSIVYRLVKALHLTNRGLWVLGSTFLPYVFLTILMFKKEITIKSQNITEPAVSIAASPHIQDSAFCEKCILETTDERPPVLRMFNGIGTGWNYRNRDKCPKCGSVIKTKCFFIGFPFFPQEKYRVIFLTDKIKGNFRDIL